MTLLQIGWYALLAIVGTAIVWKGSNVLEHASAQLARYYELPPIVQGALITAVGSSFPEFSTVVLSTLVHGAFELGVAAIAGSAIFNILIIPAVSRLSESGPLQTNRDLVYKEALFYIASVAVLMLAFSFAVIYHPLPGDSILGDMTRLIALIPLGLYVLYVFIQWQDTIDYTAEIETEDLHVFKHWLLLAASLIAIVLGVEALIRSAIGFGDVFNTPSFLWGLTMIAAASSVPDMFVSMKASHEHKPAISISNVLGSNVFDLLVAIPVGVLIAGSAVINFSRAIPLMGFLILATIVFFAFMRTDLEITKREAYGMLVLYALLILWMVLETIGVTSFVL